VDEGSRNQGIAEVLRVLRWHWVQILVVALLFAGAALAFSLHQPDRYSATATLVFEDPNQATDALGIGLTTASTPDSRAIDGVQTITSPRVRAAVARDVRGLRGVELSARRETVTQNVIVEVRAGTSARALKVLEAVVAQTRRTVVRTFRRHVNRQIAALGTIGRRAKNPLTPLALAGQRARLLALRDLGAPLSIVEPPAAAAARVQPRPARNTVLGLIVGLVIGIGLAFARASMDRVVRTADGAEISAGMPVLVRMRHATAKRFTLRTVTDGSKASELGVEAGRILRMSLTLADIDHPPRVVLVTSPSMREGKSTVAMALAAASALAGRRTLLLECDLRRPVLADRAGLAPAPGLTELVGGHVAAADVVQSVDLGAAPSLNGDGAARALLSCVTAGASAPHPAELLASQRVADALAQLLAEHDFTIIDAPPLLPVGDTHGLVQYADRVVLCARARRTTRDQLDAVRELLARLPARPAGVAVTGVHRTEEGDYGYYGDYRPTPRPAATSS
jgi:capsular exopolysaccharide synthesis family protein